MHDTCRLYPTAAALAATIFTMTLAARAAEPEATSAPSSRPDIVIVLADDLGFSDIGCYGAEIQTPNLDRLAAEGLRFTQFYNTGRCCPTRAALLTGLYPHQAGIGHMTGDYNLPGYQGRLHEQCVTIAEVLRAGGYRTLHVGKWHVGSQRGHWPLDRGFDRFYGIPGGGGHHFRVPPGRELVRDNEVIEAEADWYTTDAFTDWAVRFLDEYGRQPQPLFLYLAYTAPHWPLHAHPEDIARYRGRYRGGWEQLRAQRHRRMLEMGLVRQEWLLAARDPSAQAWAEESDQEEMDLRMAVYAAQIDRLDQGVGRVVAKLDELGRRDNTLFLFLSDNGCSAEVIRGGDPDAPTGTADSYRSCGPGWANACNAPLRLFKSWVHEGGIATPLVACWPAVIQSGGGMTDQPGHVIDLMATCLDVAGVAYPSTFEGRQILPLEGKSLAPVLRGRQREPHAALFWEHEGNRAVREGNWKLVSKHPGAWELYDLAADRTETHDLAGAHPEKVQQLAALYEQWAQRTNVVAWQDLKRPPVRPRQPAR